jgi:subtilisin family serine protease
MNLKLRLDFRGSMPKHSLWIGRASWILFPLLFLLAPFAVAQQPLDYVEGEVIVTFKTTASRRSAESSLKKRSLRFERHYSELSNQRKRPTGLVRNRSKKTQVLIQELQQDPDVESVEPNYIRWIKAVPNDIRFNEQWALRNTGQAIKGFSGTQGADIKYLEAWEKARPLSQELVVAVIDTGVDFSHPELAPRMWRNPFELPNNNQDDDGNGYADDYHGYDFVDNISDPSDVVDHGTHVAGIIAAQGNNNSGIIGIHDQVKIMALKVSADGDSMPTSAVIEAMEYAISMKKRGVNVVALNASYGGPSYSSAEYAAIQSAGDAGIVLCAAAGNEQTNNNNTPSYPASYGLPNIISVASTDNKDTLSRFSNYGSNSVDLAAPGTSILSTQPVWVSLKVGSTTYDTLPMTFAGIPTPITKSIVYCGLGRPLDFPGDVSGNIALIARGELNFEDKVANAQAAGAVAVIIYNNEDGYVWGTLGRPANWIPARVISRADGLALRNRLPATGTFIVDAGFQYMDGTSMATPYVSGAVAFAAMNFPEETATQRVQRILKSVDPKPSLKGKVKTGGRLNLDRVVDANQDGTPDWQNNAPQIANAAFLRGGLVNEPYALTLTPQAGTAPYEFTISNGDLPPGIDLSPQGELSGIPTQTGRYTFTLSVKDSLGVVGGKTFTLVIATEAPHIQTEILPEGSTGAPYTATLSATAGVSPYSWSLASGTLPPGVTINALGTLSGVCFIEGTYVFNVSVADANQLMMEKELRLTITPSPITLSAATDLPYGVKGADYHYQLTAEGGTEPYAWILGSGTLPAGISLSTAGMISGKTTKAGTYTFRAQVEDEENIITSKIFTLVIRSVYQPPVLYALNLGTTTVGTTYNATVEAQHYPKSYKLRGLPKGLKYSTKTGVISGNCLEPGTFTVYASATNPAGRSTEVSGTLQVNPLPSAWIGQFTGLIERDSSVNGELGSRFVFTTTSRGSYTLKVTTGKITKSAKGFLNDTLPNLTTSVHGHTLSLTFDEESPTLTGTHGSAVANGWLTPWNTKTNQAKDYVGYYGATLTLSQVEHQNNLSYPQGSGFLTLKVSVAGVTSIAGQTAAGDKFTSSTALGQTGQLALYQSLNKNKGSLLGQLEIGLHALNKPSGNALSGSPSWYKSAENTRLYSSGFTSLPTTLSGGYLAAKPAGSVIPGLSESGNLSVAFAQGGLSDSSSDPNISSFDYSRYTIKLPVSKAPNAPKVSLTINKSSGLMTGSFTLVEAGTNQKRTAKFQGLAIPESSGQLKALGYFLLPQLPVSGQKPNQTLILSGSVKVMPPIIAD